MSKFIFGVKDSPLIDKICDAAGVDPHSVARIVIDLQVGDAAVIYFKTLADDSMLDVELATSDIGIVHKEKP
jgi:hypothetical protein